MLRSAAKAASTLRETVENALCALNAKNKAGKDRQTASKQEKHPEDWYHRLFMKICSHIEPQSVTFVSDLLNRRNVMEHFGMNKDFNSKPDMDYLEKCYAQAQALFADITQRRDEILTDDQAQAGVFVNFSNHPSAGWDDAQKEAAAALCGTDRIVDVPFPGVSPELSEEDIRALAQECVQQIAAEKPAAVMCMGEFGLCYQVVSELKKRRILPAFGGYCARERLPAPDLVSPAAGGTGYAAATHTHTGIDTWNGRAL